MSGRFSASAWNTRANMYMPVPAIAHAMMAPKGPVAVANRPGRLKMPAPTIEPMTIAVSEKSESFSALAVAADGAEDAVDDVIFPPLSRKPSRANESIGIFRC
jgi:hypothetical protein